MSISSGSVGRRLWFAFLRRLVLPSSFVPLRLWIGSWRLDSPPDASIAAIVRAPRAVVVTCHGMFLHLLGFASTFVAAGRRPVVLVSPSRDGDLLTALLSRFGVGSWDRAHMPLPGSTVTLRTSVEPPPETGDFERRLAEVERALVSSARSLRSPVLPPALARP